jgi:hypothetical protein
MVFRLIAVALLASVSALAQTAWASSQLINFVKSSIQQHIPDKDVADFVGKVKLTSKLEPRDVEDLQGHGAGPKTLTALRKQLDASTALAPAPPADVKPVTVQIPPPSSIEQKAILEEIRDRALNYTDNLPNFICTQITRRHIDRTGTESYTLADTIQEQLTFFDHKESYKVSMINGHSVSNQDHFALGGATSAGEFGTMLKEIFESTSHADFEWERWATLRGKRMYVFSFKVDQEYSKYSILHGPSKREIISGYHGLIYADRDTKRVIRVKLECDTIPLDFPIQQVGLDMNYDLIKVGDQEYILPLKSELKSREGKYLSWNEVEFRLYRKFGTESSITFDTTTPDPLSDDQLKEQPAKPDAPAPPPPAKKP